MESGLFITFEGGEGAGKTTQISLLKSFLEDKGYTVITTREPGGTDAAEALWNVFINQKGHNWDVIAQALLVFTTRRLHTEELIKPALARGEVVISDRYTDSTRVYQGFAGGLGLKKIEEIKQQAIEDFEPDLTFIFDIDPIEGLKRVAGDARQGRDTFEEKKIDFHQRLREGYLEIAQNDPKRCKVIDASENIDNVSEEIQRLCLKSLS